MAKQEGTDTTGTGTDQDQTGGQDTGKVFTQDDLNRIVQERIARVEQKFADYDELKEKAGQLEGFADYDELKAKAAKLQQLEDAEKSEMEKLSERIEKLQQEQQVEKDKLGEQLAALQADKTVLEQQRVDTLLRMAVVAEATRQGFADPDDAYGLLDLSTLTLNEDGKVEGLEDALKKLGKAKPYLLRATPTFSPTNVGRGAETGETDEHKRARLYGTGEAPFGQHGGGVYMPKLE